MAKPAKLQAITANRTVTGETVYFSNRFDWVTDLADAALYRCDDWASDGLALARLGLVADPVNNPYLIDFRDGSAPTLRKFIENISMCHRKVLGKV